MDIVHLQKCPLMVKSLEYTFFMQIKEFAIVDEEVEEKDDGPQAEPELL